MNPLTPEEVEAYELELAQLVDDQQRRIARATRLWRFRLFFTLLLTLSSAIMCGISVHLNHDTTKRLQVMQRYADRLNQKAKSLQEQQNRLEKSMPTVTEEKNQRKIAKDWKSFRKKHLFSQVSLAEALGCSRRTVQYVESGTGQKPGWICVPRPDTVAKFQALKRKYDAGA